MRKSFFKTSAVKVDIRRTQLNMRANNSNNNNNNNNSTHTTHKEINK